MKFLEKVDFLRLVSEYVLAANFVKCTMGSYHGLEPDLKGLYVKPVLIKKKPYYSFTFRYHKRDIVQNYKSEEAISTISRLNELDDFHSITVFLTNENVVFQFKPKKGWSIRKEKVQMDAVRSLNHDKIKERKLVDTSKLYLQELRLTDSNGNVFKNAQDKWKQINHYLFTLENMLSALDSKRKVKVVDMGAGKGYLTFALYDYLKNILNKDVAVEGIEFRKDLVDLCNSVAAKSGFDQLSFKEGSIEEYTAEGNLDVLIALHACDTATDDAISIGIKNKADLIVVAPCCHKQVRKELKASKPENDLNFMTKHGVFLERHAEMLTDSIRGLIMEYFGYHTRVMEFVSDAHTPKNVLLVGEKRPIDAKRQQQILSQLVEIKSYFGLKNHYLEKILPA